MLILFQLFKARLKPAVCVLKDNYFRLLKLHVLFACIFYTILLQGRSKIENSEGGGAKALMFNKAEAKLKKPLILGTILLTFSTYWGAQIPSSAGNWELTS